jgi:hypothetical protein
VSPVGPQRIWRPPFRDAADVIIERILDRETVAPIKGFTDSELLRLVDLQNEIMDTHEDYAALRTATATVGGGVSGVGKEKGRSSANVVTQDGNASLTKGGHSGKEQIAKGIKGISKIITSETIGYPDYGALVLSRDFIPVWVFRNTDIVEYRNGSATGTGGPSSVSGPRIRFVSGSKFVADPPQQVLDAGTYTIVS